MYLLYLLSWNNRLWQIKIILVSKLKEFQKLEVSNEGDGFYVFKKV